MVSGTVKRLRVKEDFLTAHAIGIATKRSKIVPNIMCVTILELKLKFLFIYSAIGGTVLNYKSEGRWFDPRWCHWNFSLT